MSFQRISFAEPVSAPVPAAFMALPACMSSTDAGSYQCQAYQWAYQQAQAAVAAVAAVAQARVSRPLDLFAIYN